jgi:hypothetical protein
VDERELATDAFTGPSEEGHPRYFASIWVTLEPTLWTQLVWVIKVSGASLRDPEEQAHLLASTELSA